MLWSLRKVYHFEIKETLKLKLTNSLMGKNGETILPIHSCDKTLADQFLSFFHNKIDNIRTGLCAMVDDPLVEIPDQSFNGVPLNCFSSVTLQEIRHITKQIL